MNHQQVFATNKKILFLVSQSDKFRQVEIYLKKREWEVTILNNIKEAIIYVIQNKPSYFFISYEFPNKKALALIKALEHQTSAVLTGETSRPHVLKGIHEFNCKYKLSPPFTGPGVERLINKIIKDLSAEEQGIKDAIKKGTLTPEQERIIKIKSSYRGLNHGDSIVQNGVRADTLLASIEGELSQFNYYDAGNGEAPLNSASQSNPHPQYSLEDDSRKRSDELFEALASEALGAKADVDLSRLAKFEKKDILAALNRSRALNKLGQNELSEEDKKRLDEIENEFEKCKSSVIRRRQRKHQSVGYGKGPAEQLVARSGSLSINTDDSMSLIESGTHDAVDSSIKVSENIDLTNLPQVKTASKAHCIYVDSTRFQGYLIIVFAKEQYVDKQLIENTKNKLYDFLQKNGENPQRSDFSEIKLREVSFKEWSINQAEFTKTTIHESQEISISYFQLKNKFSELDDHHKIDKKELPIEELDTDLALEFDLYLHFELNNKTVIYTNKGQYFLKEQKDRLVAKGIKKMYIDKDALPDLKKYRATSYLNKKILEFQNAEAGAA